MAKTEVFPNMKDDVIEAIRDKLIEYKKHAKALTKARTRCGEVKSEITELMHEHGRKTYVDEESGYTVALSKEEVLEIKAPKAKKDGEEENGGD